MIARKTKVIHGCTLQAALEEILASAQPVILKGLVKDWRLVRKAAESPLSVVDYLKSFYNGKPSLVNRGHPGIDGKYFYNEDLTSLNYDTVRMNLDEALELILASIDDPEHPSYYISSNGIDSHFPGLRQENDLKVPRRKVEYPVLPPSVKIWIGTRSVATCHYDALDNIACCIAGHRRFTLFPPDQFENLYFGPLELTPGGQAISMVDFENPDYDKHPKFRLAQSVGEVAELEPGDAVYIPSMWMHHVEGLSLFNILINYWWDDGPAYAGGGTSALYHALLSLRDRPAHEKAGWKCLFDYYIFSDASHAGAHLPEHARGLLGAIDEAKARRLRSMLINALNR